MIICHRKRFIFIKNRKVAGTSVEIWLSQFCGPKSVITEIEEEDEKIRKELGYRGPQNFEVPLKRYSIEELAKWIVKGSTPPKFRNHDPARKVKKYYPKKYERYFVFCIERNPLKKAISLYYYFLHKNGLTEKDISLKAFVKLKGKKISDWNNYTNRNGKIIVDHVIDFENLKEDLSCICDKFNIDESKLGKLPGAKSGITPKNKLSAEDIDKKVEKKYTSYAVMK